MIIFNIDLLYNHLTDIGEAVTLAQLHIISKQILSKTELDDIRYLLKNQSINFSSDEQLYEFLNLQAYYNNSNIVFSIGIPITSQQTFSFFHLIPLPINKTQFISTFPYLAYHESDKLYFERSCNLMENLYLCKRTDTKRMKLPECVPRIITNQPVKCNISDGFEPNQILQLENNYILLADVRNITVETTCGVYKYIIFGTALIHYQNCSIIISNINYDWDSVVIHPPTRSSSVITQHLSLKKIHLDQLYNREQIHLLHTHSTTHLISIWVILIPIIIILVATYIKTKAIFKIKASLSKIQTN